ncbi:MAG: endonuclease domain-containing protein [Gammaproteobacteria bacterium]
MVQGENTPLPTITKTEARQLRRNTTDAENRLWYYLRAGRLAGLKFRRQHPVPPYILDFYCDAAKLVVELDGSQHDARIDLTRTRTLERRGLKVIRFWDNDVLRDTRSVLEVILSVAQARTLTPALSRRERGQENVDE